MRPNTFKLFLLILLAGVLTSNAFSITYKRSNVRYRPTAATAQSDDKKNSPAPEIAPFGCPTPRFTDPTTFDVGFAIEAMVVDEFNQDAGPGIFGNEAAAG